jgi:hypothetical protein
MSAKGITYTRWGAALILAACVTGSTVVVGQSVLSTAGLGEMRNFQTGRAFGMGEAGLAVIDEQQYNRWNPALSAFFEMTAAFTGSFALDQIQVTQQQAKFNNRLTRWSGGSLSVKITDYVALTMGTAPQSDYDFEIESDDADSPFVRTLIGTGGISSVYGSMAIKPHPWFAIGWAAHRYVGHTLDVENVIFDIGSGLINPKNKVQNSVGGMGYTFSGALRTPIGLSLGGFIQPGHTLTGERKIEGVNSGPFLDDIDVKMPLTAGIGAAMIVGSRVHMAADYTLFKADDMRFNEVAPQFVTDAHRIGFGVELFPRPGETPALTPRGPIFRAGVFRQQAYIRDIDGSAITETFFTLGVGTYAWRSRTMVDFGVQLGFRGSKTEDFAAERVVRFNISFSTLARWFYRPSDDEDEDPGTN